MSNKPPEPIVPNLSNMRAFERVRESKPKPGSPTAPSFSIPSLVETEASNVSIISETPREPERYKQLGVEEIQQYDDNPRTQMNSEFHVIKEALRAGGISTVILHVTRRPNEFKYTVSNGGNTRLQIIQELWAETQDERFRAIRCLIQPYDSDVHMLARHVAENSQRGDLCFWDTAAAIVKLRRKLDLELGEAPGRDFVERAKDYGLAINRSALNYYEFVVRTFQHLQFSQFLSRRMAEKIQPLWTSIERLSRLSGIDLSEQIEILLQSLDQQWHETIHIDDERLVKEVTVTASQGFSMSLNEFASAQELVKDRSIKSWEALVEKCRIQKQTRPNLPSPSRPVSPPLSAQISSTNKAQASKALVPPLTAPVDGEKLIDRVYRLAEVMVLFHQFPPNTLQKCDSGIGWFLEPLVNENILSPKPDAALTVQLHAWNVLALLSGQWHADVFESLPRESLWYRLKATQTALKNERTCLAALPPPSASWAEYLFGANPWGTRAYWYASTQDDWYSAHDTFMDLMNGVFELVRSEPIRFINIKRYGRAKEIREVWE